MRGLSRKKKKFDHFYLSSNNKFVLLIITTPKSISRVVWLNKCSAFLKGKTGFPECLKWINHLKHLLIQLTVLIRVSKRKTNFKSKIKKNNPSIRFYNHSFNWNNILKSEVNTIMGEKYGNPILSIGIVLCLLSFWSKFQNKKR